MVQPKINDPLALIQYLQDNSGGSSGSAAKDLNYQQDIMSSIFNPQFGAAFGSYDPMSLTPAPFEFATPMLTGSLNSSTPIWRQIAEAIQAGAIDRQGAISAVAEALKINATSTEVGRTVDDIADQVDAMFKEAGDYKNAASDYKNALRDSEQGNIFGKAGIAQPYEQYTIDDAPFSQSIFDSQSELEKMIQSLSLRSDTQRKGTAADTQAIYKQMMEQDKRAQAAIPNRLLPESKDDAKQLAKTLGVDEAWMMDIYDKSYGLGTVQVYDQEKQKYVNKTFTPAEKEQAFKTFIKNEIDKGTSGGGSLVGDWMSGNDDERGVKVSDYIAAGKPLITGQRKESQNQDARRGMALSMEAAKKAKAKNKDQYLSADRFKNEEMAQEIAIRKLAELQNLKDAGRTPSQDQIRERMALFGLGNNL
jgi:DNA-binding transcriptional regulator YhcF (GntR family)